MNEIETACEDTSVEEKLHARLKSDVLRSTFCLPQEGFEMRTSRLIKWLTKKVQVLSPAYVSSYKVPSLKNKVTSGSVVVE